MMSKDKAIQCFPFCFFCSSLAIENPAAHPWRAPFENSGKNENVFVSIVKGGYRCQHGGSFFERRQTRQRLVKATQS